ncbi:hypothetical protein JCM8547_001105 [Rhodosporidiobolus lusitaniae]
MADHLDQIEHFEEQIAQVGEEIEHLEQNPHVKPHWDKWRNEEVELAEDYLKYHLRLARPDTGRRQRADAENKIALVVGKYAALKNEEDEADMEGSALPEETVEGLEKLKGKMREEKELKEHIMMLRGPEAASDARTCFVEDISEYSRFLSQHSMLASLMQTTHKEGFLMAGGRPEQQQAILHARLVFQLMSTLPQASDMGEMLEAIYRYINYLQAIHHPLPERAQNFLRLDSTGRSTPAGYYIPPPPSHPPPASPAESTFSASPPPSPRPGQAEFAPRRPPPRVLRAYKKRDRVSRLQRGLEEDEMGKKRGAAGLSERKRAIYEGRVGW